MSKCFGLRPHLNGFYTYTPTIIGQDDSTTKTIFKGASGSTISNKSGVKNAEIAAGA